MQITYAGLDVNSNVQVPGFKQIQDTRLSTAQSFNLQPSHNHPVFRYLQTERLRIMTA